MSLPETPDSDPDATPGAAAATAHRRRKAERPQELLDAALALFVEKGFAATRAEEVARRAGVSKGTLYLYFASKQELLEAVIRERLSSRIAAAADRVADHPGSCAELLRDVLTQWWSEVLRSDASGVFKLVIAEVRNFPEIAEFYFREVVEPGQRLLGAIVERGIAAGEFRDLPADSVVHSLVLPMVMLCVHKHSLGVCHPAEALSDPQRFIQQHMDLLLHGLTLPGPAPAEAPLP
ncbi:MAG: TetR/AcrR family transcriptional regulator [Burkholderiaceae bacterium]|nr:TetR/AcrR family transcriptional regulator [Burkholderiaceae bacterium]